MKKTQVKIIKRDERNRQENATEEAQKSPQEAARDMVATVSEWVNEFQQKRRLETTQAIKTLFTDTAPQASKA